MEDTKCRLVLAGGLGCKSQEVSGQSSRDSHSVNLTSPLHPTPSLASSCWDSKDGIGQTVGEKYKSQAWLRGL